MLDYKDWETAYRAAADERYNQGYRSGYETGEGERQALAAANDALRNKFNELECRASVVGVDLDTLIRYGESVARSQSWGANAINVLGPR